MADARKPCRCTLLESGQADMAKLVRDYVDSLSADEKTDEATYAARLNICRTCDDQHRKSPPGGCKMSFRRRFLRPKVAVLALVSPGDWFSCFPADGY